MAEDKARLLRIRKQQNKKRPSFRRFHSWRYKKLAKSGWRKQRGIDNKTRRKTKTGVKSPEPGYRSPKGVRYLHPSGFKDVRVLHIKELEELDPEVHAIRIASRLGVRKRLAIVDLAQERGFRILNLGISKDEFLEFDQVEGEVEDAEEEEEESDEDEEESDEDD